MLGGHRKSTSHLPDSFFTQRKRSWEKDYHLMMACHRLWRMTIGCPLTETRKLRFLSSLLSHAPLQGNPASRGVSSWHLLDLETLRNPVWGFRTLPLQERELRGRHMGGGRHMEGGRGAVAWADTWALSALTNLRRKACHPDQGNGLLFWIKAEPLQREAW